MDPTFFGDKENPLFGIYHAPLSPASRDTAVLICYPILQEYIRSHRALRYLADQLSKAGCHVFRFDYFATGDSAGSFKQASLAQWQESIRLAEQELRDLSGVRKISIVGLRFGAMLAAQHDSENIQDMILWDPVSNGRQYIEDLKIMHKNMLVDPDRFIKPRHDEVNESATELLGFSVNNELCEQIQQSQIIKNFNSSARKTCIIVSEDKPTYQKLNTDMAALEIKSEYLVIPGVGDWDKLERLEDMLMPYSIMNKLTELLA